MGAGKTTVGQRCAELLDRPFVDTDELVEADTPACRSTRSSPTDGEHGFRELERVAVADACASPDAARDRVRRRRGARPREPAARCAPRGVVVWLQASPAELAHAGRRRRRLAAAARGGDAAGATLARLSAVRATRLRSRRRTCEVDTEGRTVDDVAATVVEEFRAWNG